MLLLSPAMWFETLFCWNGLISALRIVISPRRLGVVQCGYLESLTSSAILVCWSLAVTNPQIPLKRILRWGALHAVICTLALFPLPSLAYFRLGSSVCFLEFNFTHGVVALIHGHCTFRLSLQKPQDDLERKQILWRIAVSIMVCLASTSFAIAAMFSPLEHIGFWNIWMLVSGARALHREIYFPTTKLLVHSSNEEEEEEPLKRQETL